MPRKCKKDAPNMIKRKTHSKTKTSSCGIDGTDDLGCDALRFLRNAWEKSMHAGRAAADTPDNAVASVTAAMGTVPTGQD